MPLRYSEIRKIAAFFSAVVVVFGGLITAGIWISDYAREVRDYAREVEKNAAKACVTEAKIEIASRWIRAENLYSRYINTKVAILNMHVEAGEGGVSGSSTEVLSDKEREKDVLWFELQQARDEALRLTEKLDSGETCDNYPEESS